MAHVWNEKYSALYIRTYRVLYDAGINEALADEFLPLITVWLEVSEIAALRFAFHP